MTAASEAAEAGSGGVEGRVRTVLRAPAKVNLSLLVGPVRADGYHPLSTVFAPVGLWDEIDVDVALGGPGSAAADAAAGADSPVLEVVCPGVDPGANLVTRAVRAVETLSGRSVAGRIVVRKHIPTAAGLGGGSSDAAAVLRCLIESVESRGGARIAAADVSAAARGLGADVPFFLGDGPALAGGVGDELQALRLPPLDLVLALPRRELSTALVYRTFDEVAGGETPEGFRERRLRNEAAWRALERDAAEEGASKSARMAGAVAALLRNDLQQAAVRLVPELRDVVAAVVAAGALGALVSGSGPTVFGVFPDAEAAESAARELQTGGVVAHPVRTSA